MSIFAASQAAAPVEQLPRPVRVEPLPIAGENVEPHRIADQKTVKSQSRTSRLGPWSLAASTACVLIVLALVASPRSTPVEHESTEPDESSIDTPVTPRTAPQVAPVKDPAVRLQIKRTETPATLPVTKVSPEAPATVPILQASVPPPLPKLVAAAEPAPAVHAPAPSPAAVEDASLFTVTGCLDVNKDGFRLNDTTGENVPQSRSWKSGFLRKRSATIFLEDTGRVALGAHVGELVTVTGKMEDRDMEVRSLRRVASTCDK